MATSLIPMTTIGSYDAKAHLARLLDEVEQGKTITITRYGREVAQLVPASRQRARPDEIIEALRVGRQGVRRGGSSVREMIAEGRP